MINLNNFEQRSYEYKSKLILIMKFPQKIKIIKEQYLMQLCNNAI